MEDIINDLFKIYLSCIDSYNSKIHQIVNDKYTVIDKAMLTVYLYIKIIEDKKEQAQESVKVLSNYLQKQIIYGETGNLSFEIPCNYNKSYYQELLDNLIIEKFEYKNRLMQKLKYNYKYIELNKYSQLLIFLENVAEFVILQKMILNGNQEAKDICDDIKNKIISEIEKLDQSDYFYKEKYEIISLIKEDKFWVSQYGGLMKVSLSLRNVYRYSSMTAIVPENVLFHQYTNTIISLLFAEYLNKQLNEKIDIHDILLKSLFHDFGEYKGTEIITNFKNYSEETKKMFAEIEASEEKELETKIGENLYIIISKYKNGAEGFVTEMIDKILGIMKIWIEVEYFNNYTFIKIIDSIYQDRFKRFLRVEKIEKLKNKSFYIDFLKEIYIYIKEHLIEKDLKITLKYYRNKDIEEYRKEIKQLKSNPNLFLR